MMWVCFGIFFLVLLCWIWDELKWIKEIINGCVLLGKCWYFFFNRFLIVGMFGLLFCNFVCEDGNEWMYFNGGKYLLDEEFRVLYFKFFILFLFVF